MQFFLIQKFQLLNSKLLLTSVNPKDGIRRVCCGNIDDHKRLTNVDIRILNTETLEECKKLFPDQLIDDK